MLNKYNVILTKEESDKWKEFCIRNGIKWFRSEYYDKMYCEIMADEREKKLVDQFLEDLENAQKEREN